MSVGLRCKPLLDKAGSCQRAVAHVHDHFAARFASPGASLVSFSDLPDVEPEFTEGEVLQAVGQLKTGKTTGMSKVSVELLRALVSVSFGLYVLTSLLNSLLRFQLFDSVWWCRQRGTQQGGSHSPVAFKTFCRSGLCGSLTMRSATCPSFLGFSLKCSNSLLTWAWPSMSRSLASLAFTSLAPCLLAWLVTPFALGPPIWGKPSSSLRVMRTWFLRCVAVPRLRSLLTVRCVFARACSPQSPGIVNFPRHCFHSLVLVALSLSNNPTSRLCGCNFVTLLTWMLGGRAHPSWFAVECLQALRHAVKLWGRTSLKLGIGFLHAWCGAGLATCFACPPLPWSVPFCFACRVRPAFTAGHLLGNCFGPLILAELTR